MHFRYVKHAKNGIDSKPDDYERNNPLFPDTAQQRIPPYTLMTVQSTRKNDKGTVPRLILDAISILIGSFRTFHQKSHYFNSQFLIVCLNSFRSEKF